MVERHSMGRSADCDRYCYRACPMPHPRRPPGSSSGGEGRQRWATALSFLHVAFVCLLELLRLRRNEQDELAVEGVILRHDLAVLCRQGDRLALWSTDRTVLAGLSRLVSRAGRGRFFDQPSTELWRHRDLVRRRWTYPQKGRPVRPAVSTGTVQLMYPQVPVITPKYGAWQ